VSTVGWFHCFAGIAGDMALGSLIDAGADVAEVRALLDRLPLRGWSMEVAPVLRGGIAASKVDVIAGMEGALASVVGGLAPGPVVAVPTSAGYGAALEGVTALLGMLATCAAGVTVVGIDNGFGAACAIVRIVQSRQRHGERHG